MAMSVVYTTINGRLIQQVKGGQVTKFVSDTLGSVVAEVDDTGQITHTSDYWPYGEVRTETGTKKSPFVYVGVLGYMKDVADALYVRARYLRTKIARWQSLDPLWPNQSAFAYCEAMPTTCRDATGLYCPCKPCSDLLTDVDFSEKDRKLFLKLMECISKANGIDAVTACLLKYGAGMSGAGLEKAKDYLACLAVQNMFDSLQGSKPPCNPCADMYVTKTCFECCYMKYLSCFAGCIIKHRKFYNKGGLGTCLAKCKKSFEICGFEYAAGEPC